jgi:hypothetical protein
LDTTATGSIALPAPDTNAAKTKFSKVIGWPEGKTPTAPIPSARLKKRWPEPLLVNPNQK